MQLPQFEAVEWTTTSSCISNSVNSGKSRRPIAHLLLLFNGEKTGLFPPNFPSHIVYKQQLGNVLGNLYSQTCR